MAIPAAFAWKHYTEVDLGWGCVYRSFQNAMLATRHEVPSLEALMDAVDARALALPPEHWIEPAMLRGVAPAGSRLGHVAWPLAPALKTTVDEYPEELTSEELFALAMTGDWAVVLDDGVFGYCLYRGLCIDPHSMRTAVVTPLRGLDDFRRRFLVRGAMVLAIPRKI